MAKKKFKEKSRGVYQGHCACPLDINKGEPCGSSDAGSYYQHDDNTYSFSCFSCGGSIPDFDITTMVAAEGSFTKREIDWEEEAAIMQDIKDNLVALSNPERKLKATLYEKYEIRMDVAEDGETIEKIYYPTYRENETGDKVHVGYRNRKRFKSWHTAVKKDPSKLNVLKDFSGGVGDTRKGICLFGEHVFEPGGNRIFLTCGEEDALAVYHMTSLQTKFEGGYPTVSTPSGEKVAWIKPRLKYLNSFKEIFIVADQDKAGRAFEEELCQILPVGKVRLIRLPKGVKDPCDLWRRVKCKSDQGKISKIFWNAIWDAERYCPSGVFTLSEGWDKYKDRNKATLIPFPDSFGDLNEKTYGGYALGEVINIIAPSSVGKSSFTKEMFNTVLEKTPYNIGVIALEETIDEFIEGMLSVYTSTQLNEVPYNERDYEELERSFSKMCTYLPEQFRDDDHEPMDRIHFLDHQGAVTGESLLEKIDFLINGLDCKVIMVDPVTLGFSGSDTDDDEMASEIVRRVKSKNLAWINVHHVRKNSNGAKANSEGADLSEEDIKGCLSADSEYLTPGGWKRMDEYVDGDLIAEFCPKTKTTRFVEPKSYVALPSEAGFYHLKSAKGIDAMVSPEHTMYYQKQRSSQLHTITAREMVAKHRSLSQGFRGRFETVSGGHTWGEGIDLTDDELRLQVACQADATVRTGTHVEFNLKKSRKKERLVHLLKATGVDWVKTLCSRKGYDTYSCTLPVATKTFKGGWWDVSKRQAEIIIEECTKWDGHEGDFRAYFNNCKESCDFIQYLAMGLGIRTTITKESPPSAVSKRTGKCYWVRFVDKSSSTVSLTHKGGPLPIEQVESEDGIKYCFITSTGAFVSRRNGRIMMTGNTGAWFQTGMINLIFTRNKVHDNEVIRNTTKIKMSKCRRHGKSTGVAGYIYYDGFTGRLQLGQDPSEIEDDMINGESRAESSKRTDDWA